MAIGRTVVDVGGFAPDEALTFLQLQLDPHPRLRRADNRDTTEDQQLGALAQDLGFLPLALSHALAYMIQENVTVESYRREFAHRDNRLADVFPRAPEIPDPFAQPLETTWAISLELAARLVPAGIVRAVMLLAAYLDLAGIPLELFTTPTMVHCLTDLAGRKVRARDARKAVRALVRLTLLNEDEGARWREITVHSLVQRATREAHHGEHEVRTIADDSSRRPTTQTTGYRRPCFMTTRDRSAPMLAPPCGIPDGAPNRRSDWARASATAAVSGLVSRALPAARSNRHGPARRRPS